MHFSLANYGLALMKFSEKIKISSSELAKRTFQILDDNNKMQASLPTMFNTDIGFDTFVIKKFECKHINYIYDENVNKDALILHYKGVWNDFLIKAIIPSPSNFKKYKIFANVFQNTLSSLNKALGSSCTQSFLIYDWTIYLLGRPSIWHPCYHVARNTYKLKNSLLKRLGLREK